VPFTRCWSPSVRALLSLALGFAAGVTGCAETTFNLSYDPGFARTGRHVSTFGIKRDGLLSRSGWAALGPEASAPFEAQDCEVAYSDAWFGTTPELADAVEGYVNNNGVTDALLERLLPAAQGDTIMLVTIAGRPQPRSSEVSGSPSQRANPGAGAGRGGRMGRGGGGRGAGGGRGGRNQTGSGTDGASDPFEVSAALFSVREHRTVARVHMSYTGPDIDQALRAFGRRLQRELPGATCSGWNWSAHVDAAAIRGLNEP
jgi:hypothetical protein